MTFKLLIVTHFPEEYAGDDTPAFASSVVVEFDTAFEAFCAYDTLSLDRSRDALFQLTAIPLWDWKKHPLPATCGLGDTRHQGSYGVPETKEGTSDGRPAADDR